jgi:hypothetical protein
MDPLEWLLAERAIKCRSMAFRGVACSTRDGRDIA